MYKTQIDGVVKNFFTFINLKPFSFEKNEKGIVKVFLLL